MEKIAILLLHV